MSILKELEYYKKMFNDTLPELAKRKGCKLVINENNFIDYDHLNCLWYGGHVADLVVSDEITLSIDAIGDVRATLFDSSGNELVFVKDKSNGGRFYDEMSGDLKNDRDLLGAVLQERLICDNNNWFEVAGIVTKDGKGVFIDLCEWTDNVLDDSLDVAIKQVIEDVEEITKAVISAYRYEIEE